MKGIVFDAAMLLTAVLLSLVVITFEYDAVSLNVTDLSCGALPFDLSKT
jgi:hypothetical protein